MLSYGASTSVSLSIGRLADWRNIAVTLIDPIEGFWVLTPVNVTDSAISASHGPVWISLAEQSFNNSSSNPKLRATPQIDKRFLPQTS